MKHPSIAPNTTPLQGGGADNKKTVVVIGLGSMGNRRLRLLRQICPDFSLCGVDSNASRRDMAAHTHGITVYPSIAEAITSEQPEAAVISTSPLSHAAIIGECLEAGLHVFTEINLISDRYKENIALAESRGLVLFLSSTFLYREETRYIIHQAKNCCEYLNYRYHVGQYLPDWHPWEDYTQYFVKDKRTNSCRELFAIELPWLQAAFGPIEDICVIQRKCSKLNIPYNDTYHLLLRHANGHLGSLCVDVVSRRAVRKFELYSENLYLTWDGVPDSLYEWNPNQSEPHQIRLYDAVDHQKEYAAFLIENAYSAELSAFFAQIETGAKPPYGFLEDLNTLKLIDQIEQSN